MKNIIQCCKKNFLFLPVSATLGIPLPALSSPASHRLTAHLYSWVPTPPPLIWPQHAATMMYEDIRTFFLDFHFKIFLFLTENKGT